MRLLTLRGKKAMVGLTLALMLCAGSCRAGAEGGIALDTVDSAVAAALAGYAAQIGEPLTALVRESDPLLVTGAQAITELMLDDAARPVQSVSDLCWLPALTKLTIRGGTLTSLEGLRDHPSLQSLTLIDCPALDLSPLAGCQNLSAVTLAWSDGFAPGGAYDLAPLAQCPRLGALTLSGACVADVASLPAMKKLTALSVERIAVTDYAPVGQMSWLTNIRLYGATGDQVAAAFAGLGKKLASAYVGDSALTPEANAALLKCTRLKSLGFDHVTGVDSGAEGWPGMTSLTSLWMKGGTLKDLSFLAGLTSDTGVKLTDIALGASGTVCSVDLDKYFLALDSVPAEQAVQVLSGERRRWNYATLRMAQGEADGAVIAALGAVQGLLSLDVRGVANDAFKAECWAGFTSLQQLKLRDCENADLSMLTQLTALKRLELINSGVTGAEAIAGLRRLETLTINTSRMDGWAFLDTLKCGRTLNTLAIAGCGAPESIAFATRLPKLQTLALEDSLVTDLTPLANLSALESVYLYGAPATDYSPLASLAGLKLLACDAGAALPDTLACRVENRRYIAEP